MTLFWRNYLTHFPEAASAPGSLKISRVTVTDSSAGKESTYNAGDTRLIPGVGRSPGEGKGYPLQYSWASLVAQLVKNPPAMRETWVQSLVEKIPWRRDRLPTPVFWPGEFHGLYSRKESDTTERLSQSHTYTRIWRAGTPSWSCSADSRAPC